MNSTAGQLAAVSEVAEERLRRLYYSPREVYAYVTYGAVDQGGMLKVLTLKIHGPASKGIETPAQKVVDLETVWLPVIVSPDSMMTVREMFLIEPSLQGNVLWLSLASLTIDPELRFRIHRNFVGEDAGWAVAASGFDLDKNTLEMLTCPPGRVTWRPGEAPPVVKESDWGHRLRCLDFRDAGHAPFRQLCRNEICNSLYTRPFDSLSAALACDDLLREAAVAMLAATQEDNLDWKTM